GDIAILICIREKDAHHAGLARFGITLMRAFPDRVLSRSVTMGRCFARCGTYKGLVRVHCPLRIPCLSPRFSLLIHVPRRSTPDPSLIVQTDAKQIKSGMHATGQSASTPTRAMTSSTQRRR